MKTYIKGWNWVPIDVMYGVPQPEKLNHLLTMAQEANVNLLRVWCGGNELQDVDGVPLTVDDPVLAALRDAVRRLHPDAAPVVAG